MPHIFPCPVPRTQFAEGEVNQDGQQRRRRRPSTTANEDESRPVPHQANSIQEEVMADEQRDAMRKKAHECPVPKPTGRVGELLGFAKMPEHSTKPIKVHVEPRTRDGEPPAEAGLTITPRAPTEDCQQRETIEDMKFPILHAFHFDRIVIDEFTYVEDSGHTIFAGIQAVQRWELSGTAKTDDHTDLKQLAHFLGVDMGEGLACSSGRALR
ncbi:MAG: hypothetical protein Q9228_005113 [Teloschistes exilis]